MIIYVVLWTVINIAVLLHRESGYNLYRGWTQTDYQHKHYSINQKDEETKDDRGRDGGTKFILRIKEQQSCLTLQEHDDDDDNNNRGPRWHSG